MHGPLVTWKDGVDVQMGLCNQVPAWQYASLHVSPTFLVKLHTSPLDTFCPPMQPAPVAVTLSGRNGASMSYEQLKGLQDGLLHAPEVAWQTASLQM